MYTVGPPVRASITSRKINRVVRWEALFQVVGMNENSASVAAIIIDVATAPPNATADQVIGAEGNFFSFGEYTLGEL